MNTAKRIAPPTRTKTIVPSARGAHMPLRASVGGFSMLEVLISALILSFGLLGTVGMQAAALQSNRESRTQSVATALARELGEMMRGNKDIALLTAANPYLGSFSSPLVAATPTYCLSVGATACADPTAIANAQMTDWLARVVSALPGARVAVCFDAAPFDANGIPRWTCSGAGQAIVIKIGWTKSVTDRSAVGAAAFDSAITPSVVIPLFLGSNT